MSEPYWRSRGGQAVLYCGDALEVLPRLEAGSVDCVVSDPPYAEVDREYGRLSERDWSVLMRAVVGECRRLLTPRGSAVFVLQPNSERVGRMRPWLWDFLSWCCREWNVVQDAWWWNPATPPTVHCHRTRGLMRPSVKACVWLGGEDCYRNQDGVLWKVSDSMASESRADRALVRMPGGQHFRPGRVASTTDERGGVTPFNLLPIPNSDSVGSAGASGHGAGTPLTLCDWWVRYLCPPGGLVLDPFCGTATVGMAALRNGCRFVGVERHAGYLPAAVSRLEKVTPANLAFLPPPAPVVGRTLFDHLEEAPDGR